MNRLVILVPVLDRPHRVKPVFDSAMAATDDARVLFVCDENDRAEYEAVRRIGEWPLLCSGTYGQKINTAVRATIEPLIFLGADDLDFKPGWLDKAEAYVDQGAHVVGVNDLIERSYRPAHATHFLVTREYAQEPNASGDRGPLCEQYRHWYVDDELIATATRRGVYAYAEDSHVEHLHPIVGKAPDDPTYVAGREHKAEDRRLFRQRARLF